MGKRCQSGLHAEVWEVVSNGKVGESETQGGQGAPKWKELTSKEFCLEV